MRAPAGLGPQSLGEALRLLRYRARTSREGLAKLGGISTGAISNYENDACMPSASTLRRLAVALSALLGSTPAQLWDQLGEALDTFDGHGGTVSAQNDEEDCQDVD